MSFIFSALMLATALYIVAAFATYSAKSICDRHKAIIMASLPSSIRGLREYIRERGLQSHVKARAGKSVSKCSKQELLQAIA
jgi:hypothetical protein